MSGGDVVKFRKVQVTPLLMRMHRLMPVVLTLVLCAAAAQAHHSLAGMYDQSRRVMLDGTIAQFQFVNPHPFVMIDVTDTNGATQSWKAELDNRRELIDIGMSASAFNAGDRVLVTGSPGRTQTPLLYVWRLERPADGFLYEQVGTSPRVSRVRR